MIFDLGKRQVECIVEQRNGVPCLRVTTLNGTMIVLPDAANQIAIVVGHPVDIKSDAE